MCDDGWGNSDARVACRQLGFSDLGAVALNRLQGVVPGTGRTWLDSVQCRGNETQLIACRANPLGNENCDHTEDAGVRCQAGTYAAEFREYLEISAALNIRAMKNIRIQQNIFLNGGIYIIFFPEWMTTLRDSSDKMKLSYCKYRVQLLYLAVS